MDKKEAIAIAEKAGTFTASNIQCADSCTTFAPPKPATNSNVHIVEENEARMDMDAALRDCLKNTHVIDTTTLERTEVPLLIDIYEKHFAHLWTPTTDIAE